MNVKVFKKAQLPSEPSAEPSWFNKTLTQAATGIAAAPFNIVKGVGSALADLAPSRRGGMPELTKELYEGPNITQQARTSLEESRGLKEGSLTPKGFTQETLDRIYSDSPFLAATAASGGLSSFFPALGLSTSANAGAQVGKELGGGPIGELLGYLGGAATGAKGLNKLQSLYQGYKTGLSPKQVATGVRPHLEKVSREAYKNSEKLFKDFKVPAEPIEELITPIQQSLTRGATSKAKTEVLKNIEELTNKFQQGQVPIQDLIDFKKDFNKFGYSRNSEEAPYFRGLARQLKDYIQEAGAKNPEALKAFNQGEQLHGLLNSGQEVLALLKDTFSPATFTKSKLLKSLFGIGGQALNLFPAADAAKFLIRRPEARKYYADVIKAAASENPAAAIGSLKSLVKMVGQYEGNESLGKKPVKVFKKA